MFYSTVLFGYPPFVNTRDNTHGLSAFYLKTHILECPHLFHRVALYDGFSPCQVFGLAPEGSRILHQHIAQSHIAAVLGLVADGIYILPRFSALMTISDIGVREKR